MILSKDQKLYILEKQLAHACIEHPEVDIDSIAFVTEDAKEIVETARNLLKTKNKKVSCVEDLITENKDLDADIVDAILSTEYSFSNFNVYKAELEKRNVIVNSIETLLNNVEGEDDDISRLIDLKEGAEEILKKYNSESDSKYLTIQDLANKHIEILEERKKGIKFSFGDYTLDKLIPKASAGIISIVGYSGSTKSTLISYLSAQRLRLGLPTGLINTELSQEAVLDNLASTLFKICYKEISGASDDENVDYQEYIDLIKDSLPSLLRRNRFAMFHSASVKVNDIIQMGKDLRRMWNIDEKTPIVILADLLSMVHEFNNVANKASAYENAMNKLNAGCLDNNIILIGTFQLKRNDSKVTIKTLKDLDKFEPSLELIKNSSSIEERSRGILSIFNKKHTLLKSPHSQELEDVCSPAIIIKVLKNSFDEAGKTCKFKYNSYSKCYDEWTEEDEKLWAEIEDEQSTMDELGNDDEASYDFQNPYTGKTERLKVTPYNDDPNETRGY